MENLLILGAGGYGRTIKELAQATGKFHKIDFLDDLSSEALGPCREYTNETLRQIYRCAYPAFGTNPLRIQWLEQLVAMGYTVPVLVHPKAYVSPSAVLGRGCAVLAGAVVGTGTAVGEGCIVNIGAIIDHDCVLQTGVHAAPGVVIKACNTIAQYTKIESGTVLHRK